MKKYIYILLLSIIILTNLNAKKYSPINDFTEANNLYTKKDILNALKKYQEIYKKGYDNFELNYNIGCCYFKFYRRFKKCRSKGQFGRHSFFQLCDQCFG